MRGAVSTRWLTTGTPMRSINRRTFIRSSALGVAGAVLGLPSCSTHPVLSSSDGRGFSRSVFARRLGEAGTDSGAFRALGRHQRPELHVPGRAAQRRGLAHLVFGLGSARALSAGLCGGGSGRAHEEGPGPVLPGRRRPTPPLAIGNLPDAWKPVQGVHLHLLNGKHRLYFWAHGPQILRYLAAESDDGRRYRVLNPLRPVLYHPSDRAAFGVASPDGLKVHAQQSRERPAGRAAGPLPPGLERRDQYLPATGWHLRALLGGPGAGAAG